MKQLATFILLLSALTSQATNVRFNIGTITGGQTNLSFTVQGLVMPFGSTNFVVTGYPMRFTPSGGTITTNLVAGTYRLTFIGPSPAQTVDFAVTNSASTLDVSDLASWTLSKFTASQYYTIDQADARFARAGEAGTNTFRVLNVKELGAEGDGTTDDTTAIQNAINLSTNSALPSSVYFPPGRYKVTSSLRIWPNDTTQNLGARTGPTRLLGDGSGVSIIESYVTNGAAIDARIAALDGPGLVGFTMERLGIFGPIGRGAWTNDASEGLAIGRSNAVHWTGTNWVTEGYGSQYYGHQIRVQDCDFSGFTKAIGSTNVWGFVVDGGTFHSNRLQALAFNCTHSVSLRNVSIYGIAVSNRLTDIAIGFFAPREAPSWWGFGDTAEMHQTQVQWARVAVYNDELALTDIGGNYQFIDLAHQIRSGSRTNGSNVEIWRPYANIQDATYCDSFYPWVTNSPAMVELDSYVAPRVTLINLIGDVCKNVRSKVNIIGATATGTGNNGTLTFGTTNLDYPQLIGGVSPWPALFNGSNVISLTKLTNSAVGIQNGSSGVMLDTPAFYPSIQIESDSLGSQGVTLGTADTGTGSRFTISDSYTSGTEYLRVDDAGISSAVPFAGNASGLTNFTFDTLQTFNDITNTGSLYNSGSILGFGGLNIRGGNVIATNGTTTLGNVTATGTFTGNGSGLTNLTSGTGTMTNAAIVTSPALYPAFLRPPPVQALSTGPLRKPPMGWHPWNAYGCAVNQELLLNMVREMKRRGLHLAGYTNSISLDDGWQLTRDGSGYPVEHPTRYSWGLSNLVSYIHTNGFKAAVWTPMDTWATNVGSCGAGFAQGSGGYEAQDVERYRDWGFDYLKLDNFGGSDISVKLPLWRTTMDAAGWNPHVMTVGYGFWWTPFVPYVNQMRVMTDIRPTWDYVMAQVAAYDAAAVYMQPGLYPDLDMLEVGVTNVYGNLTYDEELAHFQLWSVIGAPLILGCNVSNLTANQMRVVTNADLIAINQDSAVIGGRLVKRTRNATGTLDVYLKPLGWIGSGTNALLLLNNSTTPSYIPVTMRELGLGTNNTVRCVTPLQTTNHGIVQDYFRPVGDYYYTHQSKVFIVTSDPSTGSVVRAYTDYLVNSDANATLSGTFTGTFTGNGSGLTNLNPNAITNAPWLSSASNAWTGTFAGNGSGISNVVASGLNGGAILTGNITNSGAVWTGGILDTNYATGNWARRTNGSSTWGTNGGVASVTVNGQDGSVSAMAFVGGGGGLTNLPSVRRVATFRNLVGYTNVTGSNFIAGATIPAITNGTLYVNFLCYVGTVTNSYVNLYAATSAGSGIAAQCYLGGAGAGGSLSIQRTLWFADSTTVIAQPWTGTSFGANGTPPQSLAVNTTNPWTLNLYFNTTGSNQTNAFVVGDITLLP